MRGNTTSINTSLIQIQLSLNKSYNNSRLQHNKYSVGNHNKSILLPHSYNTRVNNVNFQPIQKSSIHSLNRFQTYNSLNKEKTYKVNASPNNIDHSNLFRIQRRQASQNRNKNKQNHKRSHLQKEILENSPFLKKKSSSSSDSSSSSSSSSTTTTTSSSSSSSQSIEEDSFKDSMRQLFMKVHPDIFAYDTIKRQHNQESLTALNSLIQWIRGFNRNAFTSPPINNETLSFYCKQDPSYADPETTASGSKSDTTISAYFSLPRNMFIGPHTSIEASNHVYRVVMSLMEQAQIEPPLDVHMEAESRTSAGKKSIRASNVRRMQQAFTSMMRNNDIRGGNPEALAASLDVPEERLTPQQRYRMQRKGDRGPGRRLPDGSRLPTAEEMLHGGLVYFSKQITPQQSIEGMNHLMKHLPNLKFNRWRQFPLIISNHFGLDEIPGFFSIRYDFEPEEFLDFLQDAIPQLQEFKERRQWVGNQVKILQKKFLSSHEMIKVELLANAQNSFRCFQEIFMDLEISDLVAKYQFRRLPVTIYDPAEQTHLTKTDFSEPDVEDDDIDIHPDEAKFSLIDDTESSQGGKITVSEQGEILIPYTVTKAEFAKFLRRQHRSFDKYRTQFFAVQRMKSTVDYYRSELFQHLNLKDIDTSMLSTTRQVLSFLKKLNSSSLHLRRFNLDSFQIKAIPHTNLEGSYQHVKVDRDQKMIYMTDDFHEQDIIRSINTETMGSESLTVNSKSKDEILDEKLEDIGLSRDLFDDDTSVEVTSRPERLSGYSKYEMDTLGKILEENLNKHLGLDFLDQGDPNEKIKVALTPEEAKLLDMSKDELREKMRKDFEEFERELEERAKEQRRWRKRDYRDDDDTNGEDAEHAEDDEGSGDANPFFGEFENLLRKGIDLTSK